MGKAFSRSALLMSGGIGDYLHYLCRVDSFLSRAGLHPNDIVIYVESTVPEQVDSLLTQALPEFELLFVPPSLHWTKTNPLLNVDQPLDRVNRAAYRYVLAQKHNVIVDWFLPFLVPELLPLSIDRIARVLKNADALKNADENKRPDLIVSLRDKGFLWWPAEGLCRALEHLVGPDGRIMFLGTATERPDWRPDAVTAPDVLAALNLSVSAKLFIGTDTGLATARELLRRPNVYCVSEYWYQELMVRYRYISLQMLDASGSVVATSGVELLEQAERLLRPITGMYRTK
jgi:hypothetical protein